MLAGKHILQRCYCRGLAALSRNNGTCFDSTSELCSGQAEAPRGWPSGQEAGLQRCRRLGSGGASGSVSRYSALADGAELRSNPCLGSDGRITSHGGGHLVDLMVRDAAEAAELIATCSTPPLECSDRNACDIHLLLSGGFSPLDGFMNEHDFNSVVRHHRLPSGLLFGLPVVLDTHRSDVRQGQRALLTHRGLPLAVLDVDSVWAADKAVEAWGCFGTTSLEHSGTRVLTMERGPIYLGGRLHGLAMPQWPYPCETPAEVRAGLPPNTDVVAFQCRNPVHRAHYELFSRSLAAPNVRPGAVCLIHPTCGPTQDDDIPGVVRYHSYEVLKQSLGNPRLRWAMLPYSMLMAGPREALQHMILRRNFGCTHFIIGRDMAGCKSSLTGEDFYAPFAAQEMAEAHADELGVQCVSSPNIVYTEAGFMTADQAAATQHQVFKLSGTKFRAMLRAGQDIPDWFAFPCVVNVLRAHMAGADPAAAAAGAPPSAAGASVAKTESAALAAPASASVTGLGSDHSELATTKQSHTNPAVEVQSPAASTSTGGTVDFWRRWMRRSGSSDPSQHDQHTAAATA